MFRESLGQYITFPSGYPVEIFEYRYDFQEATVFRQGFCSLGFLPPQPTSNMKNSSVKFSGILDWGPNIFPPSLHNSYLTQGYELWLFLQKMALPSPLGALSSHLLDGSWHEVLHYFLSHLLFWNVLPDSAPPPRLLLSVLKYQSLPYEIRRDTRQSQRGREMLASHQFSGLEIHCQAHYL